LPAAVAGGPGAAVSKRPDRSAGPGAALSGRRAGLEARRLRELLPPERRAAVRPAGLPPLPDRCPPAAGGDAGLLARQRRDRRQRGARPSASPALAARGAGRRHDGVVSDRLGDDQHRPEQHAAHRA
ncbi:unnamed protein product, partial [Ectocarpus fasciculatus]